jgi:zinc transport system ATP-binding protein
MINMDADTMIQCSDVSFAYGGHTVVRGLNFSLKTGAFLCVAGENGSGKSTLLAGFAGLKTPAGGVIRFGAGHSARKTGYLPQEKAARPGFPAGVFEVVLSGRLAKRGLRPFYAQADKLAARQNMERLGVWDLRGKTFGELSGGQRRRVLLARALCAAETLLLLDEPAAGLDPPAARELYRLLGDLRGGLTIVMVSHELAPALKYANNVLHLGRRFFFGSAEEYPASVPGKEFLHV